MQVNSGNARDDGMVAGDTEVRQLQKADKCDAREQTGQNEGQKSCKIM